MTGYTFTDLGYGGTIERPDGTEVCFVQGDDYEIVMDEIGKIEKVWSRKFGKGFRKSFGPYRSQEEHESAYLEAYDC